MLSRLKNTAIYGALLLVSLTLGLLLCEGVLRFFVQTGSFRWVNDSELGWNRPDEARDYVLTPGYSGRLMAPEFENRIRINRLGFRGPEPGKNPRPIFVVGDSFVFGVGAEEDETIPARLAHHLEKTGKSREVWNLGVPSHSSPQYRRTLEHYGRLRSPEAVVVCLFMSDRPGNANDLWGAVTFENEQLEKERRAGDASSSQSEPAPRWTQSRWSTRRAIKWLKRNSALYVFLAERAAPALRARRDRMHRSDERERERLERGWALLERDLAAMAQAVEGPLIVVHIPEASDVWNQHWQNFERLQTSTDELDLPLVDLRSEFPASEVGRLYYPVDGHLTPAGYDLVAEAVSRVLAAEDDSP